MNIEERVHRIEERNARVEMDKKWEGSLARKALIALFTYTAIGLYFQYILQVNPWINTIVPTIGFLLSTLTLPFFKRMWVKMQEK
ncbi:MAG: hypothetical protein HZA34_03970 [Candidatus Pacebacteria bacterium]|nr:hypothetical protein [Candidatus Paceibacterota bacterium]